VTHRLHNIDFCCIEGEIGVLIDLSKIVTKRRFQFNNSTFGPEPAFQNFNKL